MVQAGSSVIQVFNAPSMSLIVSALASTVPFNVVTTIASKKLTFPDHTVGLARKLVDDDGVQLTKSSIWVCAMIALVNLPHFPSSGW